MRDRVGGRHRRCASRDSTPRPGAASPRIPERQGGRAMNPPDDRPERSGIGKDPLLDLPSLTRLLQQKSAVEVRGRVTGLVGIVVKAMLPEAWVGELCHIRNPHAESTVRAEVVGFERNEALLMPLGELSQIGMASEVIPTGRGLTVRVGDGLLGRVLN